jgi:hypothetical protein
MFYKPFSTNLKEFSSGNEDDMAVDFPFKDGSKDFESQEKPSRGSDEYMDIEDEPSVTLSPSTRLREF